MREIKFRVMCGQTEQLIYDVLPGDDRVCWKIKDRHSMKLEELWGEFEDGYSQYTGLKDKNGKEIYEGDIVRGYEGNGFSEDVSGIVKYCGMTFAYVGKTKSGRDFFCYTSNERMEEDEIIEAIGNIYENADLLESNK